MSTWNTYKNSRKYPILKKSRTIIFLSLPLPNHADLGTHSISVRILAKKDAMRLSLGSLLMILFVGASTVVAIPVQDAGDSANDVCQITQITCHDYKKSV